MRQPCALLFLLLANPALPAGPVSGTWKIEGQVSGNAVQESCAIKQDGQKLTGSCKAAGEKAWDVTGTVDGQKVTFQHGGEYNGDALTLTYTGTLDEKGTLKGTIDVAPFDASGDFTATKEK